MSKASSPKNHLSSSFTLLLKTTLKDTLQFLMKRPSRESAEKRDARKCIPDEKFIKSFELMN